MTARMRSATYCLPVRVYYEDTDAAGVVYYANYLRFMERARTEWLSMLGVDLASVEREHGIVFAVHRVDIEYRLPARLGDRLDATLVLVELGRAARRGSPIGCCAASAISPRCARGARSPAPSRTMRSRCSTSTRPAST